jgi:hypothetical protein
VRKPETPFGYAVFCDDIRRELGNKSSLLGIYAGVANFDADFPITIPKFCIAVNWVQHRDDERKPIKLRVLLENDQSAKEQIVIEGDIPVESFDLAPRLSPEDEIIQAMIHIALAPLVVEEPSRLKVRAMYGDEEYRLGSLHLMKGSNSDA